MATTAPIDKNLQTGETSFEFNWPGGTGSVVSQDVAGTGWSDAVVDLEYSLNGGSSYDAIGGETTMSSSQKGGRFELPPCKMKLNLSSGTFGTGGVNFSVSPSQG